MATPVLRVGLIGFGTVGRAFAHHFLQNTGRLVERTGARLELARIAVRDPARVRPLVTGVRVSDDAAELANDPALDLLVEASGALQAEAWLTHALRRGLGVISANKQAIAGSPALLRALAERHPLFHCEGAVAAAVPVVRALRDSLDGEDVRDIRGILNGTSTFLLSQVEQGVTWNEALEAARRAGYTELDSSADLDGSDAAAKLAILATVAWRTPLVRDRVSVRGLDPRHAATAVSAAASGRHLRLVAEAWNPEAPLLLVEPRELLGDDPLAHVSGVTNAVEITARLAGQLRWFGPGAGGDHTASALLGDLAVAARNLLGSSARRVAA